MKKLILFFISIVVCFNAFGQNIYTGKIIIRSNPCQTEPCLPGLVFGLETISNNYVLTIKDYWIWADDKLIVDDIEYLIEDEVEITGTVTIHQDIYLEEFFNLEIITIKKLTSNIESLPFSNNKVYYDKTKQVIVIDETFLTQSLTFELVDVQGKIILRETVTDNTIHISNLLSGLYVYRLTKEKTVICVGKILI